MNLEHIRHVVLQTHFAALSRGIRPTGKEIQGPPGGGKTETCCSIPLHAARELNEPVGYVLEMPASYMSADAKGFMLPQKIAGQIKPVSLFSVPPWMPGPGNTVICMPDGEIKLPPHDPATFALPRVGWLIFDEWGQAEDDVKKPLANVLLEGSIGDARLPVGWGVLAISNRMKDRSGTLRPMLHVVNRRCLLEADSAVEPWNNWVNALPEARRPHFLTVSFANQHSSLVFIEEVPPGDEPYCTPRSLVRMDQDLMALRTDEEIRRNAMPTNDVAKQVAKGWIGGGTSAQFWTHVKYSEELPTMEAIRRDPLHARLPERRDAQMIAAFMVAQQAEKASMDQCFDYITRLSPAFQHLCFGALLRHDEKAAWLHVNKKFAQWIASNSETFKAARG